jgi:nucleotide-binding universal stress UspA family protein
MAQILKVKVTLLHIFPYVPKHQYKVPVEWIIEIIRMDVRSKIEEIKHTLVKSGVETEIEMLEDGIPAVEIVNYICGCESPLLIMGTRAFGGMERFLLGSTAEAVLRQADCPVITVGPQVGSSTKNHASLRNMLFATDFSENSLAAIPIMLVLQQACGAHLRVLHVSGDHLPSEDENKQFGPISKALQGTESAEYVTLHGANVSQAVVNEAERYPADLLVLGVRRAHESATHLAPKIAFQIIAAAPCAVLTFSS